MHTYDNVCVRPSWWRHTVFNHQGRGPVEVLGSEEELEYPWSAGGLEALSVGPGPLGSATATPT